MLIVPCEKCGCTGLAEINIKNYMKIAVQLSKENEKLRMKIHQLSKR